MPPRTGDADGVLIAAAREGDAEAFGELWERVRDQVHGLCRHVTGCRTDALDALQETQIAVWRAIGGYEGRAGGGAAGAERGGGPRSARGWGRSREPGRGG